LIKYRDLDLLKKCFREKDMRIYDLFCEDLFTEYFGPLVSKGSHQMIEFLFSNKLLVLKSKRFKVDFFVSTS